MLAPKAWPPRPADRPRVGQNGLVAAATPEPPLPPPRRLVTLLRAAAALPALAVGPAAAQPACPPQPPRVLLERFVAAPCVPCWKEQPPLLQEHRDAWVLDWVVPIAADTPRGQPATPRAAFLANAALLEAADRVALAGPLASDEAFSLSHPLAQRSALALEVRDTPLPDGRIELRMAARFTSQRPLPAGLQGWLVLVERIAAGEQESPVDRQVVRAVVGPLPLEGLARRPIDHLRTVAQPAAGKPERLAALGWVETTKGRVIAVGRGPLPDCPAPQ
jgi:hypothetical protein